MSEQLAPNRLRPQLARRQLVTQTHPFGGRALEAHRGSLKYPDQQASDTNSSSIGNERQASVEGSAVARGGGLVIECGHAIGSIRTHGLGPNSRTRNVQDHYRDCRRA
jgi:hypothetical protein